MHVRFADVFVLCLTILRCLQTRAIQYPGVFREEAGEEETTSSPSTSTPEIERMPWDVLVKLYESRPESMDSMGDFTLVLLRLKELFDAATSWQEEVSNDTMLSLRGGKRRSTPVGENGDVEDGQQKIDLARVAELSTAPILKKVSAVGLQQIEMMQGMMP